MSKKHKRDNETVAELSENEMQGEEIEWPEEEEVSPERKALEDEYNKAIGRMLISSPGSAAETLTEINPQADLLETLHFMNDIVGQVQEGNLGAPESLLITQSYALNAVFHSQIESARRSKLIVEGNYHADIAFRAQAQCNRTLRTLLEYKNPKRATFIKQQNNMQINQAEEKKEKDVKPANELLEVKHERLDTGAPAQAGRSDTEMETVGEIHGAEDN